MIPAHTPLEWIAWVGFVVVLVAVVARMMGGRLRRSRPRPLGRRSSVGDRGAGDPCSVCRAELPAHYLTCPFHKDVTAAGVDPSPRRIH